MMKMRSEQPISEQMQTAEEKSVRQETNTKESEFSPTHEIQETVVLAEDIAVFRTELEKKMFGKDTSRNQWKKIYEETLAKYPQVLNYKPIFDSVINSAERVNDKIRQLMTVQNNINRFLMSKKPAPSPETIKQETAKRVFANLFHFRPGTDIKMSPGKVSIRFVLGKDDFKKLRETLNIAGSAHGFAITRNDIHIRILYQDSEQKKSSIKITDRHEFEHVRNRILEQAGVKTFESDSESDKLEMPEDILERLTRRYFKERFPENLAKDELLATFTVLENSRKSLNQEQIEGVKRLGRFTTIYLTDPDIGYYMRFVENAVTKPSEEERTRYVKNVGKAVEAFLSIFFLYNQSGDKYPDAARVASNVLSQFPLSSWPAITRLIISRRKTASPGNP